MTNDHTVENQLHHPLIGGIRPMVVHPREGIELIPGYRLRHFLGQGGSGQVWEVEAPGGIAKAMKIMVLHDQSNLVKRELEGLKTVRSIRHPYLLALDRFEVVQGQLLLVMELADYCLAVRYSQCRREGLQGIPRAELLMYMREAAEVLDQLNHDHGLLHLDVKPSNLLICSGHVKVADFGLVQPNEGDHAVNDMAFSLGYTAPERFDGTVHPATDQYSLACTYQQLLSGTLPFAAQNIIDYACQQHEEPPHLSPLPADDQIVMSYALHPDPTQRFSNCLDFVEALSRSDEFAAEYKSARWAARNPKLDAQQAPVAKRRRGSHRELGSSVRLKEALTEMRELQQSDRLGSIDTPPPPSEDERVRSTFLATLPSSLFNHKMMAFIKAMEAHVVDRTKHSTVLRLSRKGLFGRKSNKGLLVKVETHCVDDDKGTSLVDVCVWSEQKTSPATLNSRGTLLVCFLKSYLMASEGHGYSSFEPAVIQEQLWSE